MQEFTDVTYEADEGLAWITINRPDRYNAFRARTVDELVMAFKRAWASDDVGVVALTGAGGNDGKRGRQPGAGIAGGFARNRPLVHQTLG